MRPAQAALVLLAAVFGLAACTEKPQTAGGRKADSQIWVAGSPGYVAPGWKAGDQASWQEQMRARAQNQNEYTRAVPTAP
jgi:hypothetical protein